MRLTTLAPAKINVCLLVGPARGDGRHELVTVMQPVSLADTVTLVAGSGDVDVVHCEGVVGENLAAAALAAFRSRTGWDSPPVRIEIAKRIPVSAGMAGGSADAGAVLRLAAQAAGGEVADGLLLEIATSIGADVPSQVRPGRVLATGAGERLERLERTRPYGVLVLPSREGLATGDVYREADRLGLPRDESALRQALAAVRAALPDLPGAVAVNDLQAAACSLRPDIEEVLRRAGEAGAEHVLVSGSGPTVLGLFGDPGAAARAARALGGEALACTTVAGGFAEVRAA